MDDAAGPEAAAPKAPGRAPRPLLLGALAAGLIVLAVAAVLVLGRVIGDRLEDDPASSEVPVTATGAPPSTTTAPEPVVLAPPASIDSSAPQPGG